MNSSYDYSSTFEKLHRYGQQSLLDFYDELSDRQKGQLLEQISQLDFAAIPGWIEKYVKSNHSVTVPEHFEPATSYPPVPTSTEDQDKFKRAKELGVEMLSAGKVAAFVVAGGQGTRLGFDGPKGNFPISPVKNKTLFQIFAETILAAAARYDTRIPWYIMTSPLNHVRTIEIFEANHYFGLDESDVFMFQQGTNPNFAVDGSIL